MSASSPLSAVDFPEAGRSERIGPPTSLDTDQQAAADELIRGPRGGVYGPFRPLLHRPPLLRAVARVGEVLRYEGGLDTTLREWTICVVARELGNVFEWQMHRPLAAKAGVTEAALAALEAHSALPDDAPAPLVLARRVAEEVMRHHRLSEATYAAAVERWGAATVVELLTLVGYFAMVSWLMNVARTPGPAG